MNAEILEAILEQALDPDAHHGGFVTAMAERRYADAAFRADGVNLAIFGELVKFREWFSQYGESWARDYIEKVSAAKLLADLLQETSR